MQKFLTVLMTILLTGCASLINSQTKQMSTDLRAAILDQEDPAIVRDGAPAFLILMDSLIRRTPDDVDRLLSGAVLYASYATVFAEEPKRARRLSRKAKDYAWRALCVGHPRGCQTAKKPLDQYQPFLESLKKSDVPSLHTFGVSWAGWVQAHSDDFNAIAELPKVSATLRRVVALDEGFDQGAPHLYLGILGTLLPPAAGGKPETARAHFETAISLSGGKNLMAKVLYARHYARLVFDRSLHDRLLEEVIESPTAQPGMTLMNTLAQEQAQTLLANADEYF